MVPRKRNPPAAANQCSCDTRAAAEVAVQFPLRAHRTSRKLRAEGRDITAHRAKHGELSKPAKTTPRPNETASAEASGLYRARSLSPDRVGEKNSATHFFQPLKGLAHPAFGMEP